MLIIVVSGGLKIERNERSDYSYVDLNFFSGPKLVHA